MVDSITVVTVPASPSDLSPTANPVAIDANEAKAFAAEMMGPPTRSFEDMRQNLLSQVDASDPIKTMYAMTDVTIEAQGLSLKYSLATGLTSAVVSLFGTMLKSNQ